MKLTGTSFCCTGQAKYKPVGSSPTAFLRLGRLFASRGSTLRGVCGTLRAPFVLEECEEATEPSDREFPHPGPEHQSPSVHVGER